jgi:hypothetical protein
LECQVHLLVLVLLIFVLPVLLLLLKIGGPLGKKVMIQPIQFSEKK